MKSSPQNQLLDRKLKDTYRPLWIMAKLSVRTNAKMFMLEAKLREGALLFRVGTRIQNGISISSWKKNKEKEKKQQRKESDWPAMHARRENQLYSLEKLSGQTYCFPEPWPRSL